MTVAAQESRLLGSASTTLPRVNLLPPEIAEQKVFRKIQGGLGGVVLVALGAVALAYMGASHGVTSAHSQLDQATAQSTTLKGQMAKYNDVTATYAAAAAAKAQLASAMGDEIRYSQLLNDLSLAIPGNVWLTSVSYSQAAPAAPVAGAVPALGTFTVAGVGFSHDDVATWLESIAGLKTYQNPYFSNSTETLLGTRKTVTFGGTAGLTAAALSNRYTTSAGK
jgi:Tfp pilus assembly protein PilN